MNRRVGARVRLALLPAVGLLTVAVGSYCWWESSRLPARFAAVEEGCFYRSGRLTPGHLKRLKNEYGICRVISFLDPASPTTIAERRTAWALGLEWYNIPLRGDGSSTPADRDRIRALLTDRASPVTLVHCAAGVYRTGLAVGMYRLHCQGWSLEQVMGELRARGFANLSTHENLRRALAAEAAIARGERG